MAYSLTSIQCELGQVDVFNSQCRFQAVHNVFFCWLCEQRERGALQMEVVDDEPDGCPLLRLPSELLSLILQLLVAPDLTTLATSCRPLGDAVSSAADVWDGLTSREFVVDHGRADVAEALDAGHAFHDAGLMERLTLALESASEGRRAAYCRPTVETPTSHGLAAYKKYRAQRDAIDERIVCLDHDISDLPFHVDMLVVPSNEWLEDPGSGAMHAINKRAGPELSRWLRARSPPDHESGSPPVQSGEAIVSPSFGSINAKWLCHGVGINWRPHVQRAVSQVILPSRLHSHEPHARASRVHRAACVAYPLTTRPSAAATAGGPDPPYLHPLHHGYTTVTPRLHQRR